MLRISRLPKCMATRLYYRRHTYSISTHIYHRMHTAGGTDPCVETAGATRSPEICSYTAPGFGYGIRDAFQPTIDLLDTEVTTNSISGREALAGIQLLQRHVERFEAVQSYRCKLNHRAASCVS